MFEPTVFGALVASNWPRTLAHWRLKILGMACEINWKMVFSYTLFFHFIYLFIHIKWKQQMKWLLFYLIFLHSTVLNVEVYWLIGPRLLHGHSTVMLGSSVWPPLLGNVVALLLHSALKALLLLYVCCLCCFCCEFCSESDATKGKGAARQRRQRTTCASIHVACRFDADYRLQMLLRCLLRCAR